MQIVRNEGHGRAVDWWSLGVLIYEMLFARLPFVPHVPKPVRSRGRGKDPRLEPGTDEYKAEVKRRILAGKVVWPRGPFVAVASGAAKNLIQRLLAKSPDQRLAGDAVKEHEWFKGLDWDKLERREVRCVLCVLGAACAAAGARAVWLALTRLRVAWVWVCGAARRHQAALLCNAFASARVPLAASGVVRCGLASVPLPAVPPPCGLPCAHPMHVRCG